MLIFIDNVHFPTIIVLFTRGKCRVVDMGIMLSIRLYIRKSHDGCLAPRLLLVCQAAPFEAQMRVRHVLALVFRLVRSSPMKRAHPMLREKKHKHQLASITINNK